MELIIDIDKGYYELIKADVERGNDYKPYVLIANGKPCDETFTKDDMSGAYNEGYACGIRESERPKGEWILVGHNDTVNFYKCSLCGHEEHDNFTKHYNFCPNCGADMDMGGKEDVFTRKEELSKEESEWLIDFITKEVMTLDEAIDHCEKKAQELREAPLKRRMDLVELADCEQCAEEHEQLAKWLKELKGYRNEKDI